MANPQKGITSFDELSNVDYSTLPKSQFTILSDDTPLTFREYSGHPTRAIVLIHGSSYHGVSLHPLAESISTQQAAAVFTLDLRGHGLSGGKRGDVSYVGQLDDDLKEFILLLNKRGFTSVILGGHSSGGGLAVRFAGGTHQNMVDGVILIAPYLGYNAPTTRPNSGGWSKANIGVILLGQFLSWLGIRWLDHTTAVTFNIPKRYNTSLTVSAYSYAMVKSFAPANFESSIKSTKVPLLVLVGDQDEVLVPSAFKPLFNKLIPNKNNMSLQLLKNVSHLGVLLHASKPVLSWLK